MSSLRVVALLVGFVLLLSACGGDSPTPPVVDPPPPTGGTLQIQIQGLPAQHSGSVTIAGPNNFSRTITSSQTLTGLAAGVYTVTVAEVTVDGVPYATSRSTEFVEVAAGQTVTVAVAYQAFNLRVENAYITQSIQKYDGSIPLVAGRDGVLRVFVTANNLNTVQPAVRATLHQGGQVVQSFDIAAPTFAAPTEVHEGSLSNSWNVAVPGALIQPGLSLVVEVDPAGTIKEGNEADNRWPSSGVRSFDVRSVPVLNMVLVPIRQGDGTVGNVTEANKHLYMADALKMFPVGPYQVTVRGTYSTGTHLRPQAGWVDMVTELEAVRLGDGPSVRHMYYYGIAKIDYASGIYGIAWRPGKTGVGNDYLDNRNLNASMTLAHELGHNMDRPHSQCGSAGLPDIQYPHANGQIGSFGLDLTNMRLYAPEAKDLMGYCSDRWIGDFTYERVLDFRSTREATTATATSAMEPSLIVWGSVTEEGIRLEPAFEVETSASLPTRVGRYRLEGLDARGSVLFSYSFDGLALDHAPTSDRAFAFAIPRRIADADRLATLRVSGAGKSAVRRATTRSEVQERVGLQPSFSQGRRVGSTRLEWDAAAHPLVVVRNAETRSIISLARGGSVELPRTAAPLELIMSDGIRSERRVLRAQ